MCVYDCTRCRPGPLYPSFRLFHSAAFFFTASAPTEIYTLSLHDALPICANRPSPGPKITEDWKIVHASDEALTSASASPRDRKSTRLNSSHSQISYAVFCLKKKTIKSGALNATLCTPYIV